MTTLFLVVATILIVMTLSMLLWLRRSAVRRATTLQMAARKLQDLQAARIADGVEKEDDGLLQAAIDQVLLASCDLECNGRSPGLYAAVAVWFVVPLAASAVYLWERSPKPAAPDPVHAAVESHIAPPIDHGTDMQAAIAKLADKLYQHPADAQGWALLGRTYKAMQRYSQARDAFSHAVQAEPGDPGLAQELANAETPDPDVPGSDRMTTQICPIPGAADASECGGAGRLDESRGVIRISVNVALNPKFRRLVNPTDTVFVFAKAVDGPPMPIAIKRLTASQLPASVTLTDGMGMLPNLTLSQFSEITLGARVSKSGNATAQPGDLQTLSAAMKTAQQLPVQLTIDHRVD